MIIILIFLSNTIKVLWRKLDNFFKNIYWLVVIFWITKLCIHDLIRILQ